MIRFEYSQRGATMQPKHNLHRRQHTPQSRIFECCSQVEPGPTPIPLRVFRRAMMGTATYTPRWNFAVATYAFFLVLRILP